MPARKEHTSYAFPNAQVIHFYHNPHVKHKVKAKSRIPNSQVDIILLDHKGNNTW